ncbi:nucleotide-diphospho-sugar transferase [Tellurirhabdus bombi]|uniref:nucleotide-diphospho-sugar transferase n=1 Tax=Tellurirhabdus bombi TaxID=2907205 RepID=UPI001F2BCA38|nr:nucleotide-diphospho-sugar transferase [Tellurirhabdus bombi]
MSFDIPILFILFNRPQHSRQVFSRIRQAQPAELFVAIDGARPNHPTDAERTRECRALLDEIDWPCTVHQLIRTENLGCRRAVSSAITWFFEQVEMGIILEDDCVPDPTFFSYCREVLLRYAHESSLMHVGGVNFQKGRWHGDGSYYFSKVCHIWGWATWRRAWKRYDESMASYPVFKEQNRIADVFDDPRVQQFWMDGFESVYNGTNDTWDYQWCYAIWTNNGICSLPNTNLISNIGFDGEATHTKFYDRSVASHPLNSLTEFRHPTFFIESKAASTYSLQNSFRKRYWLSNKINGLKRRLNYKNWNRSV